MTVECSLVSAEWEVLPFFGEYLASSNHFWPVSSPTFRRMRVHTEHYAVEDHVYVGSIMQCCPTEVAQPVRGQLAVSQLPWYVLASSPLPHLHFRFPNTTIIITAVNSPEFMWFCMRMLLVVVINNWKKWDCITVKKEITIFIILLLFHIKKTGEERILKIWLCHEKHRSGPENNFSKFSRYNNSRIQGNMEYTGCPKIKCEKLKG